MMKFTLEICVESVKTALDAMNAGAGRIELCSALSEGGITPSHGLIKFTADRIRIPVHVIIRPRSGDFLYSDTEFDIMKSDIEFCKTMGMAGVVTGILLADGSVDIERTEELVRIASPMNVTFHRAFDMCSDPSKALEAVIKTGATRILTSGCRNKAADGIELIAELIRQAGNRIIIMPGSGLNDTNIAMVAKATGASEFHLSAGKNTISGMVFRKEGVSMGGAGGSEHTIKSTDTEMIQRINEILKNL